ncbi:DUF7289 family protein [Salinigranum marinum]|uniref:DUF7289 family protein n=1 Tax=Salinigranum marinum TaxID=1515595 RepID=UPI002989A384|nr:hypothetical protein [Salinigranum marinum]
MSRESDRAVSDTLGFVFIFALVLSIVGLTFTLGYGGLQDTRDFERLNNAERAFDVMGDNFDDMVRRGAPSRATEVKVADAQLRMVEPTRVNVSVTNASGATDSYRFDVEPIVYETADGRIVYVNGAIFREDAGGAVVVRHSEFILNQSRVLLPVVTTRQGGETASVGGTTTVLVRARRPGGQRESFRVETARPDAQADVMVNVTSPRPAVWKRELGRSDASCTIYGDTVSCRLTGVERVYIQETLVDITFE